MQCPNCNGELAEILVTHEYAIDYSTEQEKWVKGVGWVTHTCSICGIELNISDIKDVLKEVDEL